MDITESKIVRIYSKDFRGVTNIDDQIREYIENLPSGNKKAILNNPYLSEDDVVELIGIWNDKIVGAITYCFPLKIKILGFEYFVASGSTLYVEEDFRKESGMGAFLMIEKTKIHPSKNCLSSGISKMALPLYKKLKYTVFETPRLINIIHSKPVVEHYVPLGTVVIRMISLLIDSCLNICRYIILKQNNLTKYTCRRVNNVSEEILEIIKEDTHECCEVHDRAWWSWILNNSISGGCSSKELYEIVEDNTVVGFFFNKIEFHETASSRGFKNVNLGSVIEWGFKQESSLDEYKTQILAIQNMPKNVDAVEVLSTNDRVVSKLKRSIMIPIGHANIALRLKGVQKGVWKDKANWRIRLAAGDVPIN